MFWKSKRGWIGVDVGARAIKVAQLTADGDRLRLSATSLIPRGVDTDFSAALTDQLTAARALAQGLHGSRAAAALSMSRCRVEPTGDNATATADSCQGRWAVGPQSDYTLSTNVQRVEEAVECLAATGWHCEAIDGQPLAIARALRFSSDYRREELVGALDLGAATATFIASSEGLARYVRRLHGNGMSDILSSVAQSLGLSEKELGKLLRRHGVAASATLATEAGLISGAMKDAVVPLVQELQRTLEHLSGKLRAPAPRRVFVFGEGGAIAGLPAIIGERLGVCVEPWRASGLERDDDVADLPDCLLGQAIALSSLAWGASYEGAR